MKDYIISIMQANGINVPFYFDKLTMLNTGKFDTISMAVVVIRGIFFFATVTKSGISYELNLSRGNNSLLTFNYFDFTECMEMYELIVGKEAALIIDSKINSHYWRDVSNHNVHDSQSIIGSPNQNDNLVYEPR